MQRNVYILEKKDSRVHVIYQKHRGSRARNIGLDFVKGKYVTSVDPDDYLDKTIYEDLIALCSENEMVFLEYYEHIL